MAHAGKKYRAAVSTIDRALYYAPREAVAKVRGAAFAKFDESVDVSLNLGVDPRHADQIVRGTVVLPHGVGKKVRVLVLARGRRRRRPRPRAPIS
jgi:large subunit ribosomal protein L1